MASERGDLVSRTEDRITVLQEALQKIRTTRQRLNDSSAEAKSKIQSVMSRQLESLRNREVWLLSQVDVLEQTKEQVLRSQEDKLHHALGMLSNSLEYSQNNDDGLRLNTKLSESLGKLDHLELRPLESSLLSFRADVGKLRSSIHEFGRIDSRGLNLESVFAHPGETTSPSLPHAFEDYGDAEHHILYKTLEDIKREGDKDGSIRVAIPRLTKPNADWLSWTPETTPTPTPTRTSQFTFPPFKDSERKSNNIQEWLAHIKYETAVEEDDFEIIQPTLASAHSEPSSCSTSLQEPVVPERSFPYFKKIKDLPSGSWLKAGGSAEAEAAVKMLPYFQEAMRSSHQWLADFQNQIERAENCSRAGCASTTEIMVDIENLDKLCCVDDHPVFDQVGQSSSNLWLAGSDDDKDIDETQVLVENCRANELCNSFSECLSDEKCCSSASVSGSSSRNVSPKHAHSVTYDWFSHIPTKVQMWLCQPKSSAVVEDLQDSPLFSYFNTLPTIGRHWLKTSLTGVDSPVSTPDDGLFSAFRDELKPNTWLRPATSSNTCDVVPAVCPEIGERFKAIQGSPVSMWLEDLSSRDSIEVDRIVAVSTRLPLDKQKCLQDLQIKGSDSQVDSPQHESFASNKSLHQWLLPAATPATPIRLDENNAKPEKMDEPKSRCGADIAVWLQKKTLSVDELDVDEPSSSETVTDSVSDMFSKLGLGLGPWLRPGENVCPAFIDDGSDEDNESVWLQKKEISSEKVANYSEDALFKCFQDNQLSKWLSKSSIDN